MIETPFNYTGSKFKLLGQILPELDYTKPYFVDLFSGGGSVYTNVLDKYERIISNDIIGDLIGVHSSLLESDDIIGETKGISPGKSNPDGFGALRSDYNENPTPAKLWALMLSSTNNMMRFNQKFKYNQTYGNRGWNSNTDKKVESFINHIRKYKDKINFTSKTFDEIGIPPTLGKSNKFMFYCDPPYGRIKNVDGTMAKKQISEAGYNAFWKKDDDLRLYDYLKSIDEMGSSFMVSGVLEHNGETCWMLDKLIDNGYNYTVLSFDYNKVSRKGDKETKEIIIKNY